jgi:nitrate reductase beta subunit
MTNCDLKRQLLADYMAALKNLKVARREFAEILTAGCDAMALRSMHRIKAIKELCSAARVRFTTHRHQHRC